MIKGRRRRGCANTQPEKKLNPSETKELKKLMKDENLSRTHQNLILQAAEAEELSELEKVAKTPLSKRGLRKLRNLIARITRRRQAAA